MNGSTDLTETIGNWISDLDRYNFDQLRVKPSHESWSLGQVSMHLIESTEFYLNQCLICLSTHKHQLNEMTPSAKKMFANNTFPDELIEGPSSNLRTPQPEGKEELIESLKKLLARTQQIQKLISSSTTGGKTKHPGLHYFNAAEWFQFADMHFRHHFRQKKRIEDFLNEAIN